MLLPGEQITFIEQIQGNVLTNATKHKETMIHKRFRQKLSSSGARRQTDNKKKKDAKKRTDKELK